MLDECVPRIVRTTAYSRHDRNKQKKPSYFQTVSRSTVYLDDTVPRLFLMNACSTYATVPFLVTHSRRLLPLTSSSKQWQKETRGENRLLRGYSSVNLLKKSIFFFFCVFLKDVVTKINVTLHVNS